MWIDGGRILDARVAGNPERLVELDRVFLDHLAFVHVVRELVDHAVAGAQQRMWDVVADRYRRRRRSIHGLDRLWHRVFLVLVGSDDSGRALRRLVACGSVLRRDALVDRPLPHRPDARDPRAHRRPKIPVVARGKHAPAAVHPLGQHLQLVVAERAVLRVVRIVRIVRGVVAEEPDLVEDVEVEVRG